MGLIVCAFPEPMQHVYHDLQKRLGTKLKARKSGKMA
jgi:hypothetical protein